MAKRNPFWVTRQENLTEAFYFILFSFLFMNPIPCLPASRLVKRALHNFAEEVSEHRLLESLLPLRNESPLIEKPVDVVSSVLQMNIYISISVCCSEV